jgi:hypothetical protein
VFSFAKTNFYAPLLCQIVTLKTLLTEVNNFKADFKNTAFVHVRGTQYERTKNGLTVQWYKRKDLVKKPYLMLSHTFPVYWNQPQNSVRPVLS